MKREILFRGQVKYNGMHLFAGDWVEGSLIIKLTGWNFIHVIEKDEFDNVIREFEIEVIPETVGQFTGLTDKNGVKIFEGDVIESSDRIYKLRDFDDLIELYYWNRECVILEEYTTVIGNIHDI